MNCGIQFVKYDKNGNKQDTVGFFTSRCVIKFPGEDKDMLNASIDQSYCLLPVWNFKKKDLDGLWMKYCISNFS